MSELLNLIQSTPVLTIVCTALPVAVFIWKFGAVTGKKADDDLVGIEYVDNAVKRFEKGHADLNTASVMNESCVFEHQVAGHTNESN